MTIPKGFKLVPVEPTAEMNKEGMRWLTGFQHMRANDKRNALSESFKAMLAADPTPPQPIYDEAKELDLFIAFASDKTWFAPGFKDRDDTKMQFAEEFTDAIWIGWLACAQSRAKSVEVGDE